MQTCILLGSNVEPRSEYLAAGMEGLTRCGTIAGSSHVYETEPWCMPEGTMWFLNACLLLDTPFNAKALLKACLQIEKLAGRIRHAGVESRQLDLDILLYGNDVIDSKELTVPHPRFHLRRFALLPVCDIIPDFNHPVLNKSMNQLLTECSDRSIVRPYAAAI